MKAVVDRIVQYANRYQLTNVETGEVLGTFDFDEVTGTVQQVGTEIDKELFDSIAADLAARVKLSGGELAGTVVTFSDISGTAENVASGDTSATLWGKVKNWFSRLRALAFKNKVAAGDFEAGAIKNADVAADAAIAQSKVSGLMTDYVASISASGRTVTYKNKNGVNMGSITTQDTTYELASQSSNGLMSSTDKTKLDGIESGAQKNTVLGVKGGSESAYRTGNVNITKANIGLGNVDNTADTDKPVSTATQTALNGKANTSGTYPNLTVGKATNADNAANATKATQDASGNVITSTYATKNELNSGLSGKANTSGSYPNLTVGKATNADNAANAANATNATNATNADAIKQADTREANELPTFYYEKAQAGQNLVVEFKLSWAIGLSGQSEYCQLQTYAKWSDPSGGNLTQIAVVDGGFFVRASTGSTGWGAWEKMALDSSLPTNLSQLANDAGFIKNEANAFDYNNLANKPNVPEGFELLWSGSSKFGGYANRLSVSIIKYDIVIIQWYIVNSQISSRLSVFTRQYDNYVSLEHNDAGDSFDINTLSGGSNYVYFNSRRDYNVKGSIVENVDVSGYYVYNIWGLKK